MKSFLFQKQKQSSLFFAKMQLISRLVLTTPNRSPYSVCTSAKSEVETANSNLTKANSSTPTRAFFVRSTSTPKERSFVACSSMVACSGKGFALCCFPLLAVLQPVARYRPITLQSEAIALININKGLSAMKKFAYSFLCVNRTADTYQEQVIRIVADSEQNARFQLCADYRLALPHPIAKIALQPTRCNQTKGGIYA